MTELLKEAGGIARECPECGKDGILSKAEVDAVYSRYKLYHEGYEQSHTVIDGLKYLCDKCSAVWVKEP